MDNMQTIHNRLFYCLRELNKMRSLFSVCPDKDFSRNRSLDFVKTITTILGFQGKTLPEAFYYLFRSYAESIPVRKKYDGYRLIAADGSDVNTPHNKDSAFYHQDEIVRGVQVKGFNQLHLNTYGYRKVVGGPKFVDELKNSVTWDFEEIAEIT